jgi:hypothetical protein
MPVIRIKETDKERIDYMKGYLSISSFITSLLDKEEQPKEPEVKRPNPELKKKPTHPHFAECKAGFLEYWKKRNGYEFKSWGVQHATALNSLIRKIESMDNSNNTLEVFGIIMEKLPTFYHNKFLTAINKNYDSIIAEIKQGGRTKSTKIQDGGIYDFRS